MPAHKGGTMLMSTSSNWRVFLLDIGDPVGRVALILGPGDTCMNAYRRVFPGRDASALLQLDESSIDSFELASEADAEAMEGLSRELHRLNCYGADAKRHLSHILMRVFTVGRITGVGQGQRAREAAARDLTI